MTSDQAPDAPPPAAAEPSDATLLARAREGDGDAYRVLVDRHVEAIRRYAERRLPSRLRARVSVADVVQEAQIVALERGADFEDRGEDAFRKWIVGIVEQKVREAVRAHERTAKRSVRREEPRGASGTTREIRGREPSPSQAAIAAEAADLAEVALARLPDDSREILRLTRAEGLTVEAAARRMGRSPEAARKLLSRALLRLSDEFQRLRKGNP